MYSTLLEKISISCRFAYEETSFTFTATVRRDSGGGPLKLGLKIYFRTKVTYGSQGIGVFLFVFFSAANIFWEKGTEGTRCQCFFLGGW